MPPIHQEPRDLFSFFSELKLLSIGLLICGIFSAAQVYAASAEPNPLDQQLSDYQNARWNPIHYKPAIDQASNEQCLHCHGEILESEVRSQAPAGIDSARSLSWYQTLGDYQGKQETFHRRHLVTENAQRLMNFKCNDCHQGNNPGREVDGWNPQSHGDFSMRKKVDSEICLMCHGKFDYKVMAGLQGDWPVIRDSFNNDCITCHKVSRTKRHLLNFLNTEGIEAAGEEDSDSCYGCHGGRSWYAVAYPYVRRAWLARMPAVTPAWAEGRPDSYPARFIDPKKEALIPVEVEEEVRPTLTAEELEALEESAKEASNNEADSAQ